MKNPFLFLYFLAFNLVALGQDTTTNAKLVKEVKDLNGKVEGLKKVIEDNEGANSVEVGVLKIRTLTAIPFYPRDSVNPKGTVDIDYIRVRTKDGYIAVIEVYDVKGKRYTNTESPIELSQDRFDKKDKLFDADGNYIKINELLNFYNQKSGTPTDEDLILNKEKPSHSYKRSAGINSVFDIRLYSDLLGLIGGKSNGLIQTEASLKHVFHRSNVRNTGLFLMNYFKFNFTASKFDSKLAYTNVEHFSRTSLFQKSFVNADFSLNLLNGWITRRSYNSYYLDGGVGLNISNLAKGTDTTSTTSLNYFLEPGVNFDMGENIGISIYSKFIYNYSYIRDMDEFNGKQIFIKPSFSIFWNPIGNSQSRIFGRVSYVSSVGSKSEGFTQIQFGYSLQLTSLTKKLKD